MTTDGLARRVELIGASAVLLGALCLVLAVLEVSIPVLLGQLAGAMDTDAEPSLGRVRAAFVQGAAASAAVNVAFGVALVAGGIGAARLARWSHVWLSAIAWASIPALLVLARPSIGPVLALTETTAGSRGLLVLVTGVLLLLQVAAVLGFLRFWRRDDVRALFR